MPLVIFIICTLSCVPTILPGLFDDHEFSIALSMPPTPASSAPQILGLHEKITTAKALACYRVYESELRGKSQAELNKLLTECHDHRRQLHRLLYREKLVAHLFAGAKSEDPHVIPLRDAIVLNDIPLARYICTNHLENPNQMGLTTPLWFYCDSIAMAQLLMKNGANIVAQDTLGYGTILHHFCFRTPLLPELVEFYCSMHPPLINKVNLNGLTPLGYCIKFITECAPGPQRSLLSYAYILVNLGAVSAIAPKHGHYSGEAPLDKLIEYTRTLPRRRGKQAIVDLITYIQHPPKRSSLFEQLWNQWHDKLDG